MAGCCVLRDAAGAVASSAVAAVNITLNSTATTGVYTQVNTNGTVYTNMANDSANIAANGLSCIPGATCTHGLQNDMQVKIIIFC